MVSKGENAIRIVVREASAQSEADIEALTDFNCRLARDTEDKELDRAVVKLGVTHCLQNAKLGKYYLAFAAGKEGESEAEGKSIGTTMVTYEMNAVLGGYINWIQSVYVDAAFRKMGVFRALYNTVVEDAKKQEEVKCVRLYVEKENEQAKAVYEKLGMAKYDHWDFDECDYVLGH